MFLIFRFYKIRNFYIFLNFLENSHFFKIPKNFDISSIWSWHYVLHILSCLYWCSIYARQGFLWVFLKVIEQNLDNSTKFCIGSSKSVGPSLASLAIVSVWQSCGKPSTKFPHGGLVECLFISHSSELSLLEKRKFRFFWGNSHFFKILGNLEPHQSAQALYFLKFNTFLLIFNIRSTRFSLRLYILHRAKLC